MSPTPAILWLVLTSTAATIVDDQPYCALRYRRLCQGKGRHIACQFPTPGPGDSCQNYTAIKFTNELKHFVVNYINRRRQRLAAGAERVRGGAHLPRPEIMMQVEWDRELALLAQRLADQCNFVHDNCRATVRYPYAGQTVGEVKWRRSSESDELSALRAIRRVFDAWWGERRRVTPTQLTTPFKLTAKGTVWGHFTQLAVWSLRAVGCGAVRHGTGHPRLLLVCDFSHTNMLGERTLTPGPPAPCPLHTARRQRSVYPLLCAPVRHPIRDKEIDSEQYYDEEIEETESPTTTSSTTTTTTPPPAPNTTTPCTTTAIARRTTTEVSFMTRPRRIRTTTRSTTRRTIARRTTETTETTTRMKARYKFDMRVMDDITRLEDVDGPDDLRRARLKTTKSRMMDKLWNELQSGRNEPNRGWVTDIQDPKFDSRRRTSGWRKQHRIGETPDADDLPPEINNRRVIPIRKDTVLFRPEESTVAEHATANAYRQRWKQTRDRPHRYKTTGPYQESDLCMRARLTSVRAITVSTHNDLTKYGPRRYRSTFQGYRLQTYLEEKPALTLRIEL